MADNPISSNPTAETLEDASEKTPDQPTPDTPILSDPIIENPKHSKRKLIIIIATTILLLGIGTLVFIFNYDNFFPAPISENIPEKNEQSEHAKEIAQLPVENYKFVKWNYTPYSMANQLVKYDSKANEYGCQESVKYFTIANLSNDAILLRADKLPCGSESPNDWHDIYWFLISKNNEAQLIGNFTSDLTNARKSMVHPDMNAIKLNLPELIPPEQITIDNKSYYVANDAKYFLSGRSAIQSDSGTPISTQTLNNIEIGTLHQTTDPVIIGSDTMPITGLSWSYITPDERSYIYLPHREAQDIALNDNGTLKADWVDAANASLSFRSPLRGCGTSRTALITENLEGISKTKLATLTAGSKSNVYKLTDDRIINMLVAWYVTENSITTAEDIQNTTSNIVYQNSNGDWIFLVSSKIDAAECGKPVIYLYPEETALVNVAVGANVRLSDPLYSTGGWKNVLAHPDGQLLYHGVAYDSLFWEGIGHGPYPDVSDIGTVVAQKDLSKTIRTQLYAQGLNTKETNDFMEFWADHLPKTPWVKLTWLSTHQINQLAPLTIKPQPTTTIRVFLDAEGIATPIDLIEQKFSTPKRKGFTVVEWGGLLN